MFRAPEFPEAGKSGEAIWGDAPTLCHAQGPRGPTALCPAARGQAPTFGVPPLAVTGPLGEMPSVCSHKKWSETVESGEQVHSWLDFNGGL